VHERQLDVILRGGGERDGGLVLRHRGKLKESEERVEGGRGRWEGVRRCRERVRVGGADEQAGKQAAETRVLFAVELRLRSLFPSRPLSGGSGVAPSTARHRKIARCLLRESETPSLLSATDEDGGDFGGKGRRRETDEEVCEGGDEGCRVVV
jgi:hypothetical protein